MSEQDNLPAWRGKPGHYESWYLTFSGPAAGSGVWVRYTLHAPKRGEPEARLWFARFDRNEPSRTFGISRGVPISRYATQTSPFEIRMGDAVLRSGHAEGSVEGGGHAARWDLRFPATEPTYRMLPDALYRGGLAPSKPFVPVPDARYLGTIEVDGETFTVDGGLGQQGHVYGSRHAERWAWAHCNAFEEEPGTVLEALSAQGRRGPLVTPFTSFIGLRREGEWIRFRKVSRTRDWDIGVWRIDAMARRHLLVGKVSVAADGLMHARYDDPSGGERHCHHTDVGSCRLTLFERRAGGFEEVASLTSDGGVNGEWAGLTPAPGILAEHVRVDG